MLVYVFRDQDRSTTYAYSTDVTGRNLSWQRPGTDWAFVAVASHKDILEGEEAMGGLRRHGFYIFNSDLPARSLRSENKSQARHGRAGSS